jgi:hypothetical protein
MNNEEITRQFNDNKEAHNILMDKIEKFSEKLEDVKISIAELPKQLTDEFDKRYASKDTEDSLKKIIWIVVTAVIIALLSLVIKS